MEINMKKPFIIVVYIFILFLNNAFANLNQHAPGSYAIEAYECDYPPPVTETCDIRWKNVTKIVREGTCCKNSISLEVIDLPTGTQNVITFLCQIRLIQQLV